MKKIIKICPICHNVEEFYNISAAQRRTKINHSSISKVLRGSRKTAGGFVWKEV